MLERKTCIEFEEIFVKHELKNYNISSGNMFFCWFLNKIIFKSETGKSLKNFNPLLFICYQHHFAGVCVGGDLEITTTKIV